MAIGSAVLDVIKDEKIQENSLVLGNYLKDGLNKLKVMKFLGNFLKERKNMLLLAMFVEED